MLIQKSSGFDVLATVDILILTLTSENSSERMTKICYIFYKVIAKIYIREIVGSCHFRI